MCTKDNWNIFLWIYASLILIFHQFWIKKKFKTKRNGERLQISKNGERITNFVPPEKFERVPRSNKWNEFHNAFLTERVPGHLWLLFNQKIYFLIYENQNLKKPAPYDLFIFHIYYSLGLAEAFKPGFKKSYMLK